MPPAQPPQKGIKNAALDRALSTMTAERLRAMLTELYKENDACKSFLMKRLLVQRHEMIPYHADSESEDKEQPSEEEEEVENEADDDDDNDEVPAGTGRKRKASPGPLDRTLGSRYAICQNCSVEFDVTSNYKGSCNWHPGRKVVNDDDDFWADHDEDCHGIIEDLMDEPDY
ncbi:hypothetical protein PVAG01_06986 [Phlyctema vagabunda]|uniref:Uncharacterized protein n=1 Tax=Phlyctema vagabunda TaxID=108571 RepID=A0ABR4PB39_9HELO